jgi:predicted SAM-dependent methyltransferase
MDMRRPEDWERGFCPNSIEAILAEHVWEHLTMVDGLLAAKLCRAFLKPGGYIRCAVPDGFFPDEAYQRDAQIGGPGPQDHPAASHKAVYTYQTLPSLFQSAGLNAHLLEYCDEQGTFHAHPWDETQGLIYRSQRFNRRNAAGSLVYASLIVDAVKPSP